MLDALYIAAIGLEAQKQQLDTLANNLANAGTTAYKRQSVDFAALLDRAAPAGGTAVAGATDARASRLLKMDPRPGEVRQTGRPLDIAVIGPGFFEVALPAEQVGYSRAGSLQIDPNGMLSLASGQALKADIRIPADASDVRVLPDGSVTAQLPGEATPSVLGQLELVNFLNPEALEYHGDGIFTAPEEAEPTRARPGEDGTELLAVESLEASNIRITDEMVSLLLMQRIYELNSRVAQAADEMIGMSNNMRRN